MFWEIQSLQDRCTNNITNIKNTKYVWDGHNVCTFISIITYWIIIFISYVENTVIL